MLCRAAHFVVSSQEWCELLHWHSGRLKLLSRYFLLLLVCLLLLLLRTTWSEWVSKSRFCVKYSRSHDEVQALKFELQSFENLLHTKWKWVTSLRGIIVRHIRDIFFSFRGGWSWATSRELQQLQEWMTRAPDLTLSSPWLWPRLRYDLST